MLSNVIRKKFLEFFKNKQHTVVPSSPVFPIKDASLLFTNAGMNQFKDIFLGKIIPPYFRATSSQKCIRAGGKHNDLDNVGHTSRHLTFFEMLGNFSFGDYFKKEAIAFAWEVSTSIFNLDPDKIWASVYENDEESFSLWESFLPASRIVRLGDKDNFWSMAELGPCGPCSELLYDRGHQYSSALSPKEDSEGERFLEYWNLVFMQFNRCESGDLVPLPKNSVDTGAGLERLISLMNNSPSVFNTDILRSLIQRIEILSHKSYNTSGEYEQPAFRVIADHLRTLAFGISDGLLPGNTDRGYVLKKLIRRAVNYGRRLGFREPFLSKGLPDLVEGMGEAYPQIKLTESQIADVLFHEEENYFKTLRKGDHIWNTVISQSEASHCISGQNAFKLKDTYGLPLEEILLLAKDHHVSVDTETFAQLEKEAKEKSQHVSKMKNTTTAPVYEKLASQGVVSSFIGYEETVSEASILACLKNDAIVSRLQEGDFGCLILNHTPFYPEKGGQIGDRGIIKNNFGAVFQVSNTFSPYGDIIIHEGIMIKGCLEGSSPVRAEIDEKIRRKIACNHTATHLLHWALRQVLDVNSRQAGSVVADSHLRFDFNNPSSLTKSQILEIESLVNEKIRENRRVSIYELNYEIACKQPDIVQFFEDKYSNIVRVVDIDFSKELCGGLHACRTGDLGLFLITKESGIATGIRRIEAKTGVEAEQELHFYRELIGTVSSTVNCPEKTLGSKILALVEENKSLKSRLRELSSVLIHGELKEILGHFEDFSGIPIVIRHLCDITPEKLRSYSDALEAVNENSLVFLYGNNQNKTILVIQAPKVLQQNNICANAILQDLVKIKQGKGGGKPHIAQGSFSCPFNHNEIKNFIHPWITAHLN